VYFQTAPPEIGIILKLLRWIPFSITAPRGRVALSAEELRALNWSYLLKIAETQRVLGFVAYAIEQNNLLGFLDPRIQTLLTQSLLATQWQNKIKLDQFTKIRNSFRENGILVLPLKGVGLSLSVYRHTPFRPMGDIDCLIQKKDLSKAITFLLSQGFRIKPLITKNRWHDAPQTQNEFSAEKTTCGRLSFINDEIDLDLHWAPTYEIGGYALGINSESMWARACAAPVAVGAGEELLCDEDLAWHQVLHTAEMHNPYFVQILDIAACMRQCNTKTGTPFEDRLLYLPEKPKRIIETLLADIQALFETNNFSSLPASADQLINFFFLKNKSEHYHGYHTKSAAWLLAAPAFSFKGVRSRIKYAAGYFVPNPEYYAVKVGDTGFRMYLTHWKDLACKIGRFFWRKNLKTPGQFTRKSKLADLP